MKRISILLVLIFTEFSIYATNQVKDILKLNSDTLYLYSSPLLQVDSISEKIVKEIQVKYHDNSMSTGCWRDFQADWIIIDDNLYLSEVRHCTSGRIINEIVEKILGKKFEGGLLKADWVNGSFWCGKDLAPPLIFSTSIYYNEFQLNFRNGILTDLKETHYIPCDYSDKQKLSEFILTRIDFSMLSDLKGKKLELSAWVKINETGKILKVVIENSSQPVLNDEFINVIRQLPCLPVYYLEGEFFDVAQTISISVNENDIAKYVR